jgi:hypothetical protein
MFNSFPILSSVGVYGCDWICVDVYVCGCGEGKGESRERVSIEPYLDKSSR